MTSFAVICAGTNSERFTFKLCQACRDHQAQDKVLFVGVHPGRRSAARTVENLRSLGIRAATVEERNTRNSGDIYALRALFQAFTGVTVEAPDLIVLVLDETFMVDSEPMTQIWEPIRMFKGENPGTEIIAVYFTRNNQYSDALGQIKKVVQRGISDDSSAPLARALLISEDASLRTGFGKRYRDILARHLAILLITEPSSPSPESKPFDEQIEAINTPFVGMALAEVPAPGMWEGAATPRGRLPRHVVKDISQSLVNAIVNLLNNMPEPQTSFGEVSPESRRNGDQMLAVNVFTPVLHRDDLEELDSAVDKMLLAYRVDFQGMVMPEAKGQQPSGMTHLQRLTVISLSTLPLAKENTFLNHVPVIARLSQLGTRQKVCQILVLFGIEDSRILGG